MLKVNPRFDSAPITLPRPSATNCKATSQLLTYEVWDHNAMGRTACIDVVIVNYLLNGRTDE